MGGKSGKIRQRGGKVGGKNGKDGTEYDGIHTITPGVAFGRSGARLPRYEVVQVPAALDNAVMIELKYHKEGAVSRW